MKISRVWWWIIPLTLFWPLLHLLISYIRFREMPASVIDFLIFLPMSLTSGVIFLALWVRASTPAQKTGLILGYLLASPIALIGSLLSGLVYQPLVGTLLWGAGPLVIGMLFGVSVGSFLVKVRM